MIKIRTIFSSSKFSKKSSSLEYMYLKDFFGSQKINHYPVVISHTNKKPNLNETKVNI